MRFEKHITDLRYVSCCLITKNEFYPKEILDHVFQFPFGEFIILTNSDSPYRKHELFSKAKFDIIYYQDDDAICPINELIEQYKSGMINLAMKQGHFDHHLYNRATMGLGWGTLFEKKLLSSLEKYTDKYGIDEVFKRETERIFTYLNYPQNRLVLPITDLPSSMAPDRLWRQPEHNQFRQIAEQRCLTLL